MREEGRGGKLGREGREFGREGREFGREGRELGREEVGRGYSFGRRRDAHMGCACTNVFLFCFRTLPC